LALKLVDLLVGEIKIEQRLRALREELAHLVRRAGATVEPIEGGVDQPVERTVSGNQLGERFSEHRDFGAIVRRWVRPIEIGVDVLIHPTA